MEYSPPPLFKQGASARAKVVIFSLLAIGLLIADARLHALPTIRKAVAIVLYPLQRAALLPRDAAYGISDYFASLSNLQKENLRLKNQQIANAQALQHSQQLIAENTQLRKLLNASERLAAKSLMTEILYDARDPFTRKIVLDRGSRNGVAAGQPVIDDAGVVGQVTRVFPFTSEATLLTDKDQAIPIQVVRSGLRAVAYGRGQSGVLELRFMATNADIRKGDMLVTSGIDGIFPAGLAVAKVVQVETKSTDAFARILCQPAAGIDRNRQLLVLLTDTNPPLEPPIEEVKDKKHHKRATLTLKDGKDAKEPPRETAKPPKEANEAQGPAQPAPATGAPVKATTEPRKPADVPQTPKPGASNAAPNNAAANRAAPNQAGQNKPVVAVTNKPAAVAPAKPAMPKPLAAPLNQPRNQPVNQTAPKDVQKPMEETQ
ncbi:MAG: rod shape-determining protein MreC [Burkholderiales bacterium]|nr:rod shape-determining protein MreC [Burkholderiales bacterium]